MAIARRRGLLVSRMPRKGSSPRTEGARSAASGSWLPLVSRNQEHHLGRRRCIARQRSASSSAPRSFAKRGPTAASSSAARSTSTRGSISDRRTCRARSSRRSYWRRWTRRTLTRRRVDMWSTYHQWFESIEKSGKVRRPIVPRECGHNAHMYYLLLAGPRGALRVHIRRLADERHWCGVPLRAATFVAVRTGRRDERTGELARDDGGERSARPAPALARHRSHNWVASSTK